MTIDGPNLEGGKENFDLLYDFQILIGLVTILPLLQLVHNLIMLSKLKDVFICDFVEKTKLCQPMIFMH
jgi:hypothetical protein